MSSRTPRTPVYDSHPAIHPNTLPPPPPPTRNAVGSTPLNRQHVSQLPALSMVTIPSVGSHHSTPHSAVSHQSPFSPGHATPIISSAGAVSRGTSPMASRGTSQFNVPYDPRDWASGDVRANQALRARQQQQSSEDGLASPPPPYSPQNSERIQTEVAVAGSLVHSDLTGGLRSTPQRSVTMASQPQHDVANQQYQHQPRPHGQRFPNHRHSLNLNYTIPPPPPPPISNSQPTQNPHVSTIARGPQDGYFASSASPEPASYAPAARRAVSANAGLGQRNEEAGLNRTSNQSTWQAGIQLPGPPPGPPPSTSRSQSMNSTRQRSSNHGASRPHHLRHTLHTSGLDPVPPTPAGWDEGSLMPQTSPKPLNVDTTLHSPELNSHRIGHNQISSSTTALASGSTLSRSSAVRDSSVKGLRERRAQNRNSQLINGTELDILSLNTATGNKVSVHDSDETGQRSTSLPSGGNNSSARSRTFTPLTGVLSNTSELTESPLTVPTPPFSPRPQPDVQEQGTRPGNMPTKSLPTPPLSQKAPLSAHSVAPSPRGSFSMLTTESADGFVREAAQRHNQFLERESSARTDVERVEAFADYLIQEATIRHKRYEHVFRAGEFDIKSFRERIFPPLTQRNSLTIDTNQQHDDSRPNRSGKGAQQNRPDQIYSKDYQPALSPIASMGYDEMSSRGRAPSRWWESQTGSESGEKLGQVQRSKRESKYMGLSKEVLMAYSPSENLPTPNHAAHLATNGLYLQEKANPERFGFYDEDESHATPTFPAKKPETPRLLDISRFITLPPPYPRHFPAVNNNHPDLTQYRTIVRSLSDLSDIQNRRSRHQLSVEALRADVQRKIVEGRRAFRSGIQTQIQEGSITYAEAAEAEEANKLNEFELEKSSLQAEFDTLQDVVINPLHDMLNDRIVQLNRSIQILQDDLKSDARQQNPDCPQEEGDETPELLEKLTQLKWLFDTREQIQKECFSILSERNDKYKSIVLFPHKWNSNSEKIKETEAFFQRDTQARYVTFCDDSLQRHQEFLNVVDQHVGRGVELQSSAFWDIAPGLLDLLQKIPDDLPNMPPIQIPTEEYEENPSYHQHPQQYLYSLLSHTEKSTYQFIESQTNLHCLLHEVKTGEVAARYRSASARESTEAAYCDEIIAARQKEEAALTAELKQKAAMIEEQWLEALGSQLQSTKERVKALLLKEDAWEEIAEVEV